MNQAKTFRGPARIPRLSVACKLFYFRASGGCFCRKVSLLACRFKEQPIW